jgi:Flp pilus assembly CpaE family ATPase
MATRKTILLIEDDPDFAQLIRAALSEDTFEIRPAKTMAAALALLEQFKPEAILADLTLPDSSGFDTFLRVKKHAPGIPIVVLTGLDDDQVAIRTVEYGAQDYLVKASLQPKQLARSMNMALSRQALSKQSSQAAETTPAAPRLPGHVFSFIGSKGGVGTSTTAVNTAAVLARNGLETVLIEWQQGCPGTLSLYLETEPSQDLGALLKKPANTILASDLRSCLVRVMAGLRLLGFPASRGTWRTLDADHAHAIVSAAREAYPFVLLDLPARIDEGVAQALKLSDSIVMIADREPASLQCCAALARQIRLATSSSLELGLALVHRTEFDSPIPLADIHKELKVHPLATIPCAAASIALSHSVRTPMALLYPDDLFSVAHFELAEKMLVAASGPGHHSLGRLSAALEREPAWPTIPETTYS